MTVQATIALQVPEFKHYITASKAGYAAHGSHVSAIVLPADMEVMIVQAFFQGKLNGFMTHHTDKRGKLREYLDGTKVMFTDKLTLGRGLFVLDSEPAPVPSDVVEPPTGPGQDPGGGTPVAANGASLALAA